MVLARLQRRPVATLAARVVIAYAEPGGQTSRLAEELTETGKPPLNLDADEQKKYRPS